MLPFLRWAGGKRKLAPLIADAIPSSFFDSQRRFFEPFVGGGALMLHLGDKHSLSYIPGTRLLINDMNPDLIMTYQAIQNELESLIEELEIIAADTSKENYLRIRAEVPNEEVKRAARFIYLNKTSFNGLWRVNSKGQFNVPWGQLKNPNIYNVQDLEKISERLSGTQITHLDYQVSLERAEAGDFVYLDPPYIPLSASASFSQYAKDDFGLEDQKELAYRITQLSSKGVNVVLSNSDTPLSREIFGSALHLKQVSATRFIAANSKSRGNVMEIIGTNFDLDNQSSLCSLKTIN